MVDEITELISIFFQLLIYVCPVNQTRSTELWLSAGKQNRLLSWEEDYISAFQFSHPLVYPNTSALPISFITSVVHSEVQIEKPSVFAAFLSTTPIIISARVSRFR
jgi:hypothetical protein